MPQGGALFAVFFIDLNALLCIALIVAVCSKKSTSAALYLFDVCKFDEQGFYSAVSWRYNSRMMNIKHQFMITGKFNASETLQEAQLKVVIRSVPRSVVCATRPLQRLCTDHGAMDFIPFGFA